MARQENETFQEYLKGATPDKEGVYRTRDGRIFETAMSYPDKLTVEEFIEEITNRGRNQAFVDNMRHLTEEVGSPPEKMHAEDWIQTYAAWMEMNE
jgi:hypothetical protein